MNSKDIARGGPLPQPQPEPPEPSPVKKFFKYSWVGLKFYAVVSMVLAARSIADLAFKDRDKK